MRGGAIAAVTAVVVLAIASPALRSSPRDGFPLSNYPMFASDVGRAALVDTAIGLRPDGTVVRLSPELVTGTSEVILAGTTVADAVAAGPDRSAGLCAEIADRVATSEHGIATIRIATEAYDAVGWFEGDTTPTGIEVRATCPVPAR